MCIQNVKVVALPVPEIIGATQKLGSPRIRPRSLFPKILMGFCSDGPCECRPTANLKSVALSVPEIIAIGVLGGVANPNLGEEEAIGVGHGTVRKSVGEFL